MADRTPNGQFAKGNQIRKGSKNPNAGRPRNAEKEALKATIDRNVGQDAVDAAWARVEGFLKSGGPGFLKYFEFYLDRRHGRPSQHIEHTGSEGGPIEHVSYTDAERKAFIAGLFESLPEAASGRDPGGED